MGVLFAGQGFKHWVGDAICGSKGESLRPHRKILPGPGRGKPETPFTDLFLLSRFADRLQPEEPAPSYVLLAGQNGSFLTEISSA